MHSSTCIKIWKVYRIFYDFTLRTFSLKSIIYWFTDVMLLYLSQVSFRINFLSRISRIWGTHLAKLRGSPLNNQIMTSPNFVSASKIDPWPVLVTVASFSICLYLLVLACTCLYLLYFNVPACTCLFLHALACTSMYMLVPACSCTCLYLLVISRQGVRTSLDTNWGT